MVTEPNKSPLDYGMGQAILDAIAELSAEVKELKQDVRDMNGDVKSIKVTEELQAQNMMEWKPQLSNEVKGIHEKLDNMEKR